MRTFTALGLVAVTLLLPEARAAVGRTEASYGVTQNGAATYSIPIQATEGINGLTPHLAISYSGPGARSIFGVGFSLSGLSYITPCRKTIAQDLNAAPITLTAADRYCLDGARLRQIDSQATYGATNVQYRTEIDQMVRVTSKASTNNIPGWFQVEMPNGLEYQYGNSTDSKLMSGTGTGATPQFWALSKISDANGNAIRFFYDTDAATRKFRPSYISYTERGGAGDYRVNFVYQAGALPFKMQKYTPSQTGGAAHEEDRLLDRIDLQQANVTYRAYKFTYEAGAGDGKRLASAQECAYAPSEDCFPATVFTWQSATAGHDVLTSTSKAVSASVLPLDINGDGIQDLAWAAGGTWRYMLGSASGFGSIVNTTVTATNPTKAMVVEWNADGFDDLLIDWSDGKWRVLRGGATGFATSAVAAGPGAGVPSNTANTSWTVSDVDADGRDDLLTMTLNAALVLNVRYNSASGYGASSVMYSDPGFHLENKGFIQATGASAVRRPDFNGDGRFDLLIYACFWDDELGGCLASYRWYQLMSNGTAFTWEGAIPGAAYNIDVRFGDFNADGLTDIVYPQATTWGVGLGQGSGGFAISSGPSDVGHATYQTLVGDYDGDGYDDLYVTKNSPFQWEIYRSTGTALATTPIATSINGAGLGWMLVDQNGDSLPDIGRYDSGTLEWSFGTHQGLPAERLLSATDGLANTIALTYLPMSNSTVYVRGTGAAYPEVELGASAPIVRTLQVSPGGGTSYSFTYKYKNGRVHAQGRSFLGMGLREVTDGRNGVFTTETYRQDFPYIGVPATATLKQSSAGNAKTIRTITHTYNRHVLSSAVGNERYLPYRSRLVASENEVGGLRDGDPITEVTENYTVNTWGNSTFVATDVKDTDALSAETGLVYRTEVTGTFVENSASWCIALPLTRSEKRILPYSTNETRDVSWQVDASQCRVTQETLEPGSGSTLALVTDVGYDTCGNVNSLSSYPETLIAQARTTAINYGSRCQRPETITNPEGHTSGVAYSWPLGLLQSLTDANSLTTNFERDGFGRLTRQLRPDGTGVRFLLTACTGGNSWCGKNSSARAKVTRTERNTSDVVLRTEEQFLDGIGRLRWSHSDSLESGPAIVETLYDAFNRTTERTQPYFAGGIVYSTAYARDLIGRVTSINAPISEAQTSGRITGIVYKGRDVEVTDPGNFVTTRRSNVIGQLRNIIDPSPGGTTSYVYFPFGELASITDAASPGNVTSWSINARGFVTATSDPDSGNWTYEVNAFGETAKIRDAKTSSPNWTTQFTFDKLSRPLTRSEAEGTTTFTWGKLSDNTASNKYIGRLKSVSSPGPYSETYTFDQYSRLTRLRTTFVSTNYDFNQTYWAASGLPKYLTYPTSTGASRFQLVYNYQNNLLASVADNVTSTVYWTGTSTDAWGHYQNETLGNGIATFTDFDQASGFMLARQGGVGGGTGRINSAIKWDDLRGNLTERKDSKLSPVATEPVVNDSLSRFDVSTGPQSLDVNYDAIGNITSKDGLNYLYTGSQTGCSYYTHTQPRAVRKIGSTVYCYDANGNMVKRAGSTISYTSYNLPSVINSGTNSSTLSYGAFRNRFKQIAVSSAGTETTYYVAGLYERVTRPGGTIEYRHYVSAGNGTPVIYTRRSTGVNDTYYWHADHLGSPELLTNQSAVVQVRPSFDAFGQRRDGTDWNGAPSAADLTTIGNITRRGFTGHEHLDSVGLIHMSGRVYDPSIARFLGADPLIGIGISQDANRYSYSWNAPFRITDPSGLDEDPTPKQCIEGQCGTDNPIPADPITVIGDRFDFDALADAQFDMETTFAGSGSGIEAAFGEVLEWNDGGVSLTAKRMDDPVRINNAPTFFAGGFSIAGSSVGSEAGNSKSDDVGNCDQALIDRGTKWVEAGDKLAKLSMGVMGAGGVIATAGAFTGNVPAAGIGGALVKAGGAVGFAAGLIQLGGGIQQGLGGASWQNAQTAGASLVTGLLLSGFLSPMASQSSRGALYAGLTGGIFDATAMGIDALAPPARLRCP